MREEGKEIDSIIGSLREFVISEMKNEDAFWQREKGAASPLRPETNVKKLYSSRYITIFRDSVSKEYIISLSEGNHFQNKFKREDVGISAFRMWRLIRGVRSLCDRKEELDRKRTVALQWKNFVGQNKQLNRDINIGKILED